MLFLSFALQFCFPHNPLGIPTLQRNSVSEFGKNTEAVVVIKSDGYSILVLEETTRFFILPPTRACFYENYGSKQQACNSNQYIQV